MNLPEAKEAKRQSNVALQCFVENTIWEAIDSGVLGMEFELQGLFIDLQEIKNIMQKLEILGYKVKLNITYNEEDVEQMVLNVMWN